MYASISWFAGFLLQSPAICCPSTVLILKSAKTSEAYTLPETNSSHQPEALTILLSSKFVLHLFPTQKTPTIIIGSHPINREKKKHKNSEVFPRFPNAEEQRGVPVVPVPGCVLLPHAKGSQGRNLCLTKTTVMGVAIAVSTHRSFPGGIVHQHMYFNETYIYIYTSTFQGVPIKP